MQDDSYIICQNADKKPIGNMFMIMLGYTRRILMKVSLLIDMVFLLLFSIWILAALKRCLNCSTLQAPSTLSLRVEEGLLSLVTTLSLRFKEGLLSQFQLEFKGCGRVIVFLLTFEFKGWGRVIVFIFNFEFDAGLYNNHFCNLFILTSR